ncbi:hypothetical protein FIV42_05575 [Persicimonas caeni]|uniref:AAA+ ATPase domain-containing protein n=1 Tax=Persicimonas caeni TaxID=2292766 RepID=A0A4Y6PPF1_PERCE|nr:AAA family ATPase [Persicimonas caeni]QDG50216.1 hypothetical protein FIV42_05575 [Persicimonas caeni]QED31437.1 AAA family ATPase [Persicimonas caeni]
MEKPISKHQSKCAPEALIGRTEDLWKLEQLIDAHRLVSVLGPPGVGKSRLVASFVESRSSEPLETVHTDLAGASSLVDMCAEIARQLRLEQRPGEQFESTRDQLGRALAAFDELLLVIDNADRLVEPLAAVLQHWTRQAPDLNIVVTSRQPLRIDAEARLELAPLQPPSPDAPAAEIANNAAVRLFAERARRVCGSLDLDEENLAVIGELVRRLDGLPLAIELVARWKSLLSIEEIVERLRLSPQDLALADSRQTRFSTLEAAIAWSWELLDDAEQAGLAQCAVFAGPFDVSMAEAVLDVGESSVLGVLLGLREQSLLGVEGSGAPRMRLLTSVRRFARRRLDDMGGVESLWGRLVAYLGQESRRCLVEAERMGRIGALERLQALHLQLRAVVERYERTPDLEQKEEFPAFVDCALALAYIASHIGQIAGLRELLEPLAASAAAAGLPTRHVLLLNAIAVVDTLAGRQPDLVERLEDIAPLAAESDRDGDWLWIELRLASELIWTGRLDEARRHLDAVAPRFAQTTWCESWYWYFHAQWLAATGENSESIDAYERALEAAGRTGNEGVEVHVLSGLAIAHIKDGSSVTARQRVLERLDSGSAWLGSYGEAHLLQTLAVSAFLDECYDKAIELGEACVTQFRRSGAPADLALGLANLAWYHFVVDHRDQAAHFARQAENLVEAADAVSEFVASAALVSACSLRWKMGDEETAVAVIERSGRVSPSATASAHWNTVVSFYAGLLAALGRLERAEEVLEELESAGGELVEPLLIELARAQLDIGHWRRAGDGERTSDRFENLFANLSNKIDHWAERIATTDFPSWTLEDLVELTIAQMPQPEATFANLQYAAGTQPALLLATQHKAFRAPEATWGDLSRSEIRWQLLDLLAQRRLDAPGEVVHIDEIAERLWPDEVLTPSSLKNRLYVNLSKLREANLDGLLLRGEDGYLLDPDVRVLRQ